MARAALDFHPRYRRCELTAREAAKIKSAVEQLPAAMRGEFHALDIERIRQTRHRDVFRLKVPPFRVLFQSAGRRVFVLELDRRNDNTYSNLDRLVIRRLAAGLGVIEVPRESAEPAQPQVRSREPRRPAETLEHPNPLTPFSHSQLVGLGASASSIREIRQLKEDVDAGQSLAELGLGAASVELLADAWHDPQRYLAIFDSGRRPDASDSQIDAAEREQRLASPDSSAAVARAEGDELSRILGEPIEDWMWFLHPLQNRIVQHLPTGPSRVRGGPGTGKTVAALHRAKFLVANGFAERVLLATFVRVLPATWRGLLERFAPAEASSIEAKTVDAVAYAIAAAAGQPVQVLGTDQDRLPLAERAIRATGLQRSPSWLLDESDLVLAGRALSGLDAYRAISRRGRGDAVSATERATVFETYEHYRRGLAQARATDFAHLRLTAIELAEAGAGPRFDAIIIDEAQDLTEAHIRLLLALDSRRDHRAVMLVGDNNQAVYPGGFSLRSTGLEVRGRSFILRSNWRNTQRIADTATVVLGDQPPERDAGEPADDVSSPPRRLGTDPELHLVADDASADALLTDLLSEALASLAPNEIAVLGRKKKVVRDRAEQVLRLAGIATIGLSDLPRAGATAGAVRAGTFEYSKGLEFKLVVLVGPSLDDWSVRPFWISDPADVSAWWQLERRKMFVAMTRARDRLVVIARRPMPDRLSAAESRFAEWDWC